MTASEQEPPPPAPAASATPSGEQRLHPWSWLFVLLTRIRPFVVPAAIYLFLRQGNSWELWGAVGALGFAVYSLIYSLGFRYRIAKDELIVREGLISRTERHIPFARIQNIVQKRNVLHRWFGVTELRLESAGGSKPEAVMSVIRRDEAERLEAVLRGLQASDAPASDAAGQSIAADKNEVLTLSNAELFRLGLQSNRGSLLLGAAIAFYFQQQNFNRQISSQLTSQIYLWIRQGAGYIDHALAGASSFLLTAVIFVIGFLLLLKLASIVLTFVNFHGFKLLRDGERVATEQGLFTRTLASARRDKIQRLIVNETLFGRYLDRRSLECEIAAGQARDGEERAAKLSTLVPIATPGVVDGVMRMIAPELSLEHLPWKPLHERAAGRVFKWWAVFVTVQIPVMSYFVSPLLLLLWPLLIVYLYRYAQGWARFARYAYDGRVIAFRAGWLRYRWTVMTLSKGQTVSWLQSPFDRRRGMAAIRVDSAGVSNEFKLKIPYLPEEQARELFRALSRELSATTRNSDDSPELAARPVG